MRLIAKLLKFFANRVRRQGGNPIGEGGGAGGRYSFGSSIGTRRKSNILRSQYHYRGPRIDYWGPPHEVRVIANAARLCLRGAQSECRGHCPQPSGQFRLHCTAPAACRFRLWGHRGRSGQRCPGRGAHLPHRGALSTMTAKTITDLAVLFEHATAALNACVDRGMQLPFILCAVAPNGSVAAAPTASSRNSLSSISNPRGSGCRSQSWSWITPARWPALPSTRSARVFTKKQALESVH